MAQSNDHTSGPQWIIGIFTSVLGLCILGGIIGRDATTGDVSILIAPVVAIGIFFLAPGFYAFLPGRIRLRLEPWSTVALIGLLAAFLLLAGIVSLTQADGVQRETSINFRIPNTPSEARLGGAVLIGVGVLLAIGALVAPMKHFRAGAGEHHGKAQPRTRRASSGS